MTSGRKYLKLILFPFLDILYYVWVSGYHNTIFDTQYFDTCTKQEFKKISGAIGGALSWDLTHMV